MRRLFHPFVFALTIPLAIGLLDINCFKQVCENFVSCTECINEQPDPRIATFMCLRKFGCEDDKSRHWLIPYSNKEFLRCVQFNHDQFDRLCSSQKYHLTNTTVLRDKMTYIEKYTVFRESRRSKYSIDDIEAECRTPSDDAPDEQEEM